jgi:hypothetical protein
MSIDHQPISAPSPEIPDSSIPADLKVDWDTLNEPYVTPVTLKWAIEREQNMQSFARKLIERIGCADSALRAAREERDQQEKAHERTIKERDEAEDCAGDFYSLVTGQSAEWSNLFGYDDAYNEAAATLAAECEARKQEAVERFNAGIEAAARIADHCDAKLAIRPSNMPPDREVAQTIAAAIRGQLKLSREECGGLK